MQQSYYRRNLEKQREYKRRYYKLNAAHIKQKAREYYAKNRKIVINRVLIRYHRMKKQ